MFTNNRRFLLLALLSLMAGLFSFSAIAQVDEAGEEDESYSMWIYDVRDLAMPVTEPGARNAFGYNGQFRFAHTLLESICQELDLDYRELSLGMLLISGTEEDHQALDDVFGQMRTVFSQRYEMALSLIEVSTRSVPQIGSSFQPPARTAIEDEEGEEYDGPLVIARSRQIAQSKLPVQIGSMVERSFIEGWSPVVSDNSVGYDVQVSKVGEGFEAIAILDLGPEHENSTSLRIQGSITSLDIERLMIVLNGDQELPLDLPSVTRREFSADIQLMNEKPTVISIIDGFDEDRVILVVAELTRR